MALRRTFSRPSSPRSPLRALICAASFAFAFAGLSGTAHADALQDASKLLKQGQPAQALDQVDKHLSGKPRDAQGRFLKGVILTEMNRTADAIAVFTKLTEDYPELPEPYNNLAVIYAQQKQFEKAKTALEMAIRTHPSYATAHENLGDIYARLASQAYDKALQIDSSNASAQSKLSMIRDLMGTGRAPSAAARPAAAKPVEPKPAEAKPAAEPKAPDPKVVPIPDQAKIPEVKPEPKAEPPKPAKAEGAEAEVGKTIDAWLAAWSKKDVKGYLAFYAKDFDTPGTQPRAKWEAERRQRINKPGAIQVSQENLQVTVEGDTATAKFRQYYRSASLKSGSNKVLVLVKRDGRWLIQQERIGN